MERQKELVTAKLIMSTSATSRFIKWFADISIGGIPIVEETTVSGIDVRKFGRLCGGRPAFGPTTRRRSDMIAAIG